MKRMVPGIEKKTFQSFDGTKIAYQVRGDGPCIVLANGLGGTYQAFRYVYSALGESYKIICWDYRGLYSSDRPHDLGTLAVTYHSQDLAHILEREGVTRAALIGWSMGVQVNFEFYRLYRPKVVALAAINGTCGTPFRTAMASRLSRYVIPGLLRVMKAQAPVISRLSRKSVEWDGLVPVLRRIGMVAPTIDEPTMRELALGFRSIDLGIYSDLLMHLGAHDARDLLPHIDVPTLIITGDHDIFTPVFTARKMNKAIRGSRLVVIPGGTHYTPLEYPRVMERELGRFVAGLNLGGSPDVQRAA